MKEKNKIEIGMYVRLDRYQGINKIEDYDEDIKKFVLEEPIYDDFGDTTNYLDVDDIIGEPSYTLKQLIQLGDYVNGYPVDGVFFDPKDHTTVKSFIYREPYRKRVIVHEIKSDEEIYTVATKEDFELIQFKRRK